MGDIISAIRNISAFLLLGAALLFVTTCGGGDGGAPTATVDISVEDAGGAEPASFQPLGTGNFGDIDSITVEVYDGPLTAYDPDTHNVTGSINTLTTLTKFVGKPVTWTGQITGLPVGTLLTFVGRAFNATPDEISTGKTEVTLAAGAQDVTITLGPHSITITPPSIVGISVPEDVEIDKTATISATIEDKRAGTDLPIEYAFGVVTAGGGSWNHGAFGDDDGDGLFTLLPEPGTDISTASADYTAPGAAGSPVQSLTVDVAPNDPVAVAAVEQQFTIVVVDERGTANILTQFSPTVDGITATRVAGSTDVTFNAVATDDGSVASYLWDYLGAGTPTFAPAAGGVNNANPGVLVSYDPNAGGDISLTVTDDIGLATTVTFPLPVFPSDVIVPLYDFETGTTQGWSTTGLWHVTNFKAAGGSTRSMWFGDEATQDVGSDDQATGTLLSSSIVLGATPFLEFDLRNQNECNFSPCGFNKLDLEISSDNGATWTTVASDAPVLQTGNLFLFEHKRFALSPVLNEFGIPIADFANATVLIRFTYNRSFGPSYDGAFIDNIMVNNK